MQEKRAEPGASVNTHDTAELIVAVAAGVRKDKSKEDGHNVAGQQVGERLARDGR